MLPRWVVNFTHVYCEFHKCRSRAETTRHHQSCLYPDEEDIEITSADEYEGIWKKDKEVSSDEEPLSSIAEGRFDKYKALSINNNLTNRYNNLQVIQS